MKKKLLFIVFVLSSFLAFSQHDDEKLSNYEKAISHTGKVIKSISYSLPDLAVKFVYPATASIKQLIIAGDTSVYFLLRHKGKYSTTTSALSFKELKDFLNSLDYLISESVKDAKNDSVYIENKYKTDDGFVVGYFISDGAVNWFVSIGKYKSETLYLKNIQDLRRLLESAKQKMILLS